MGESTREADGSVRRPKLDSAAAEPMSRPGAAIRPPAAAARRPRGGRALLRGASLMSMPSFQPSRSFSTTVAVLAVCLVLSPPSRAQTNEAAQYLVGPQDKLSVSIRSGAGTEPIDL